MGDAVGLVMGRGLTRGGVGDKGGQHWEGTGLLRSEVLSFAFSVGVWRRNYEFRTKVEKQCKERSRCRVLALFGVVAVCGAGWWNDP